MKIVPTKDNILIKVEKEKEETGSGLKIVREKGSVSDDTQIAQVLKVGPDCNTKPDCLVIVNYECGVKLSNDLFGDPEHEYRIISEDYIRAVLEPVEEQVA